MGIKGGGGSDETATVDPLTSLVGEARRFASRRLKSGANPTDISFALAFVATEMGLYVTRDSNALPVFQAVLHAVSTAAINGAPGNASPDDCPQQVPAPLGVTVH